MKSADRPLATSADAGPRPDDQPIADALARHHQGLEQAFDAIVVRADGGDAATLRAAWDAFERELLRHMEIEDIELLPLFERAQPDEGHALREEHDEIRENLFELGLALDLRELRAAQVRAFADRLRAHARREDQTLYPWLEGHVPQQTWHELGRDLSRSEALAKLLG